MNHLISYDDEKDIGSWKARCGTIVDDWRRIWFVFVPQPACAECLVLRALEEGK